MILNTLSKDDLYQSIAYIFNMDIEQIQRYIKENINNPRQINLQNLKKFCNCHELKTVDSIMIHHIAPRRDVDSIRKEGISTLPQVLTTENNLSKYLKGLGFKFTFKNNQIFMERYNKKVDIHKLSWDCCDRMILMRFGIGKASTYDFNVNGYLFVSKFLKD